MAFGQPPGLPASSRQVQELLALLQGAGHRDFRDARGPMGFTQRQAAGRFTRDEATELIERLQGGGSDPDTPLRAQGRHPSGQASLLEDVPAEQLAVELRRRGWMVIEPLEP
jgi:hypothetical protein